jgi:hypothetical protein
MANPLDNYTFTPSTDAHAANMSRFKWINDWEMAYICNQMDDCPAFLKAKNNQAPVNGVQGGGYMRKGSIGQRVASTYWDSWIKKGSVQKVSEHKPNEPSVLETPVTKVSFFDGGNFDGTEWKHGRGFVNGNFTGDDHQGSIRVPLGYRFIGFEHYMNSDNSTNGAGNTTGIRVGPVDLSMSQLQANGVLDNISSYIIEQIPFDIEANWDRMTVGYIDPTDQALIKANFCRSTGPDRLVGSRADCKTILGTPEYNLQLVNKCAADTSFGWINNRQIVDTLKTIVRGGEEHSGEVVDLFNMYCRGGDGTQMKSTGGHRTDKRCACINASDFGISGTSNCFDDGIKDFPGCKTGPYYGDATTAHVGLVDKFRPVVTYPDQAMVATAISSFNADTGCLVEACSTTIAGANTSDMMLSTMQSACRNVNMTFCGAPINIGAAQDSPIQVTQNCTSGTPPGSGTSTAVGSAPQPGGTPPSGTPDSGAPPSSDTLWPADTVPGLDTKPKQIGLLFFIFIICLCCCLMIVGLGLSGSGNSGAPAAPNYSANLARLGALTSSL